MERLRYAPSLHLEGIELPDAGVDINVQGGGFTCGYCNSGGETSGATRVAAFTIDEVIAYGEFDAILP